MSIKFTRYNDEIVNQKVEADLEIICQELVKHSKALGLVAIILTGGFGRGEGSVLWDGETVRPVNDYDLLVVTEKIIPPYKLLNQLSKKLAQQVGIDFIDLLPLPRWRVRKMRPLIINYETRYGSQVLWGENILARMPYFEAKDIPLWDGAFLLFNRLLGLIWGFPAEENSQFVINQCSKAILACCESLLILSQNYHYSYAERAKRFAEVFPNSFPTLCNKVPQLVDYVRKMTEFKLFPTYSLFPDSTKLWWEVQEIYLKVFKHYLGEYYCGIKSNSMQEIIEGFIDKHRKNCLYTFLMWGFYNWKMHLQGRTMLKLDFRCPPLIWIYAAEPFLLEALKNPDNPEHLSWAKSYLRKVIDVTPKDDARDLREKCIISWKQATY